MKIIKKILLPLVLFLSLFFNTSTIFASNNLSTTFNANNDELTVTVKNNSDKELSDVEYNLNLPSEYTAKYEVNPNYSLSPQEETTLKVKVSKSSNNISNHGEHGTTTFTSSKKSLDNTGITSELTVGAIVVLFLLVGVLLYFKQRKVFVILLVAGIGTQLFPRYSLAADKIRQTENFKEHVTLLKNNIPVSLDISYLIESDSNNNGNNSGENGNNSENNGVKSNDKDPKEVLVAGYAYSGKTNNVLEEKELKVFDGDKEIATVKTDTEGYFFTHLIQDKTYTIKGEDFEVTVTAKNSGDYEYKDIVGKLTLGRIIKDNVTNIKVKPSVAFISEEKEYSINGRTITIEGEVRVKSGDKLVLAASHNEPKGAAFLVESVVSSNGKTVIVGTKLKDITEVVDEFDYNENIDVSNMQFIPSSNFKLDGTNGTLRSSETSEKISGNYDINAKSKIKLTVTGEILYQVEYRSFLSQKYPIKAKITPKLKISSDIKLNVDAKSDGALYLGRLKYIHPTGVAVEGNVYAFYDAEGHLDVHFKTDYEAGVTVGYDNGRVFETRSVLEASLNVKLNGRLHTGLRVTPELNWSGLEAVKLTVNFGPEFTGEGKADIKFNSSKETKLQVDYELTGEVTWLKINGALEIPILKNVPLVQKYHKTEFEEKLFKKEYKKTNKQQGESKEKDKKIEDKPVYSNAQLALIGRALYNNSTDPAVGELNYNTYFTMGRDEKSLMTSFGTGGSIVQVIRTDTGIDIKILDYDKPVDQRDFKLVKSATYKEIQEKFKKEDMDRINKIIEDFKNTKYYKENPYRITD